MLAALCLLGVSVAYQPQQRFTLDLAAPQSEKFLDNFHQVEGGFRWSQARSAVWLSGLGAGNLAWVVGARLSGSRPSGAPAAHVTLRLNHELLADFSAANEERDYEFTIAPGRLGLSGDLLLEIDSDTFTSSNDSRALGVRVMRVWAKPAEGLALPALKVLAVLLAALAAFIARPARPHSPSAHLSSLLLFFAAMAAITALMLDRADAAWWIVVLALVMVFSAALWLSIARIVQHDSLQPRMRHALLAMFPLAALAHLWLDTGRGYEGDVAIYMALAWKTVTYGLHAAYLQVSEVPPPNTPPFLLYPVWLLGALYQQLFSPLFPPTWMNDPTSLRYMLRLPSLVADLLTGALIFRWTRRRSPRAAFLIAALYLFTPAILFDSAYWGQTGAIHGLWMLLALLASASGVFGAAGAALMLGVLTKPQAFAIAPLVLWLAWRARGLTRLAITASLAWLVINAPFIATDNLGSVLAQYAQTAQYHPYLSVNAHNLWWLIEGGQAWQPDTLATRVLGVLLFGAASLLSLRALSRRRDALFELAAYQSLAFFMLLTQIHENHLVPLFAPLAIACTLRGSGWWLYGALSLTATFNMALHDPNLIAALGYAAEEIYGGPALALPRWLNAAAQLILFGVFSWQVWSRGIQNEQTVENACDPSARCVRSR